MAEGKTENLTVESQITLRIAADDDKNKDNKFLGSQGQESRYVLAGSSSLVSPTETKICSSEAT